MPQDIPPDLLLEAHVRTWRTAQPSQLDSPEAQEMMAAFERGEVDATRDLLADMQRADAARYLDWLGARSPLDRRLHLLVWPLEDQTGDGIAAVVIASGPDFAAAILSAMRETGLADAAERFGRIVAAAADYDIAPEEGEEADRLAELSLDFDAPGRYRQEVRAALAADAAAGAAIAAMRAGLDEPARLDLAFALAAEAMGESEDGRAALGGLDEAQRLTFLALALEYRLDSGGLGAFFAEESGDLAPETATALRVIGCGEAAQTLLRAMALFPTPFPRDADARYDRMEAQNGKLGDRLDAMTDEIEVEAIRPALLARLKKTNALPR